MTIPSKPRRVLFAWEGGAGRGHVVSLRRMAEALGPAAICDAALCRMEHAEVLAPACDRVFQGAGYRADRNRRPGPGRGPAATWADHLGDLGFGDPDLLIRQLGWWLAVFKARATRLVIADFAPCATLAARVAGIASVVTGTGYLAPPSGIDRFPVFLPDYPEPHYDENQLLGAVNQALAHFGALPLSRFSEIYRADLHLVQTIAELDPFANARTAPYLPPVDGDMPRATGKGDAIFVYFSTDERTDPALLEGIASLGPLALLYMSNITPAIAARMAAAGVEVLPGPAPFAELAPRSRLTVNAGQHGSLCAALAMGLPQLAIPRHLEHLYHARATERLGAARVILRSERDPATIRYAILDAYESASLGTRARDLANTLGPHLCGPLDEMLRAQLLPLLE